MRLRDKITRTRDSAVLRAHVGNRSMVSALQEGPGTLPAYWDLTESLVAIVEPKGTWTPAETLSWRGRTYRVTQVAVRRRAGKDHHYTLTLETT